VIGRTRSLPEEPLDGPALLRAVDGHVAIAFSALDLDGAERGGPPCGGTRPLYPAAAPVLG
jgi:hypothetical protein